MLSQLCSIATAAAVFALTASGLAQPPGLVLFRPTTLDAFPKKDTLPLMVWGNGGCAVETRRYGGFLTTIASHGFLVMGTTVQEGAPARRQATADDLKAAIDWAEKENARDGSPLKGKIARLMWTFKKDKKAGAMFAGKSCDLCKNTNWDTASKGL